MMEVIDREAINIIDIDGKRWTIKNYTGEAVDIYQGNKIFELLPVGKATIESRIHAYDVDGIILENKYIKSSPKPEKGVLFLVTYEIALMSRRPDFVYAGQTVECLTRLGNCISRLGIIRDGDIKEALKNVN